MSRKKCDRGKEQHLPDYHLQWAERMGSYVPELRRHDVVLAVLPSGEVLVVSGKAELENIVATKVAKDLTVSKVPVLNLEMAVALEEVLGGHGGG